MGDNQFARENEMRVREGEGGREEIREDVLSLINGEASVIDRSRLLTYKKCERMFYHQYVSMGSGVVPGKLDLPLFVGIIVHEALASLLLGNTLDEALELARASFEELLGKRGLSLKGENTNLDFTVLEQWTLIEGLVRVWELKRLPWYRERFMVLDVEREDVWKEFVTDGGQKVYWQTKADNLLLGIQDNELYVGSFKTIAEYDSDPEKGTYQVGLIDMQGLSEVKAIEERLREDWREVSRRLINLEFATQPLDDEMILRLLEERKWTKQYLEYLLSQSSPPEVHAVIMDYLVKGKYAEEPYKSGFYKQKSSLVHPLKFEGISEMSTQYKWKIPPGRVPTGWGKINIWDEGEMGIKEWVRRLAMGEVQREEGDALEKFYATPDFYYRRGKAIEEWVISAGYKAREIRDKIERVRGYEEYIRNLSNSEGIGEDNTITDNLVRAIEERDKLIMKLFTKTTESCLFNYGRKCGYYGVCHKGEKVEELMESGEMIRREPHHELEEEWFKVLGWVEE